MASDDRWALMHELRARSEPTHEELLSKLSPCDLVLIEGFKAMDAPKLEVWRPSLGKAPLFTQDRGILADLVLTSARSTRQGLRAVLPQDRAETQAPEERATLGSTGSS